MGKIAAVQATDTQGAAAGPRSVLERASRILLTFDQANRFQTLSAISRATGLPLTTAHRIVGELVTLGLLERDDADRLSVGTDLWKIGLCAPKASGLQRIALPFMQDMYAATGLPIHLGVREGYQVLFVESLRRDRSADERPRIGAKYPMHVTAVGLALLAHMPNTFLMSYVNYWHAGAPTDSDSASDSATYPPPSEATLRKELAGVRTEGYAVSERQADPNAAALGAPIRLDSGEAIGAISVIVPLNQDYKPYALLVRTTAQSIQRILSTPG